MGSQAATFALGDGVAVAIIVALTCINVLVGVTGFEPATSSSRTKRATKLRHTPSCICRRQHACGACLRQQGETLAQHPSELRIGRGPDAG